MNSAKLNPLIDISEVEFSSSIELALPMFMILATAMTTLNPQKIRKQHGANILNIILKNPITFMKLVLESGYATETVEKYIKTYIENKQICQKKSKFRILYSPSLTLSQLKFYELMLNPTTKAVVLILLKSKSLSQIELAAITDKSKPSISRSLKLLMEKKIIRRNYHAPYSTYCIVNKSKIITILNETNPSIANNFEQFDLCYPKPSIFLTIYN